MLPKNKLNEQGLKKAVKDALKRKPGAEKIAQAFKNAGGAKRAVKALDGLVQNS
ncbi:MAG: hypothetical protein U5K00_15440 [Melioribacteraceae bacterium]|nr:hypothetical protein [Melioribacteraceae bacterium]